MKPAFFIKLFLAGILLTNNVNSAPVENLPGAPVENHPAPPQSSPYQPKKPLRAVWPHELMTFQERHELWLKMRAARTSAERMELLAKKYAQLEKRGSKLGLVLREPEPLIMRYEGRYPGMHEESRWGLEIRERPWMSEHPYEYGGGMPRYEGFPSPRYEAFRPPLGGGMR